MTDIFNENNNLYWVFTRYGLDRLASLQHNDLLRLYSIRLGSYNWYEDPEQKLGALYSEANFRRYYEDVTTGVALGHELTWLDPFPINSKSIDEVKGIVTLSSVISEEYGGYDIREIGVYEQDEVGQTHLFAVCTMQPIPKPSTDTNHYIAVQLNMRFKSENLSSAYDQIELDPDNNFATLDQVNAFQENLLFVESNLAQQISNNSNIIGLNRAQQLYEQIINDKKRYASFAASTTYANFLNATSLANIASFWVFNHTNDLSKDLTVSDLSSYGINLATDDLSTKYEQGYCGLCSWMNFKDGQYYMLYDDINFDLIKRTVIPAEIVGEEDTIEVEDSPFSFFFVGAQNTNKHACTLMAKYNEYTRHPAFTMQITTDRRLEITLYSNEECWIKFRTAENSIPKAGQFYVLSASYNADVERNPRLEVMVDAVPVAVSIEFSPNIRYSGMPLSGSNLPLMSFIRTSRGDKEFVDSKLAILSLVKDKLSTEYVRATSFSMMALIGKDPCLI